MKTPFGFDRAWRGHGCAIRSSRHLRTRCILFSVVAYLACLTSPSPVAAERVARVIDGDTVLLEEGRKVRYAGINAPEDGDTRFRDSTQANNLLVGGKEVRLDFGPGRTSPRLIALPDRGTHWGTEVSIARISDQAGSREASDESTRWDRDLRQGQRQ